MILVFFRCSMLNNFLDGIVHKNFIGVYDFLRSTILPYSYNYIFENNLALLIH